MIGAGVVCSAFVLFWPSLNDEKRTKWENYLIAERIKRNRYLKEKADYFFWRNYNQQEVDLIELREGKLYAFEFKYSSEKKVKIPQAFSLAYPEAVFERISRDNHFNWIT